VSDLVLGTLVTASGAIVVALITLYQHRSDVREKKQREDTDRNLTRSEGLFDEYRHLLDEHREEHERDRAEITQLRSERDEWRGRAVVAERQVEQWIRKREGD
jgi:chromosome segregation ATPase